MKTVILLAILGVISIGVYEYHDRNKLAYEQRLAEARSTLDMAHGSANLGDCFTHLGVTILNADQSANWRRFKKTHGIDSTPDIMSDADLRDCKAIPVQMRHK